MPPKVAKRATRKSAGEEATPKKAVAKADATNPTATVPKQSPRTNADDERDKWITQEVDANIDQLNAEIYAKYEEDLRLILATFSGIDKEPPLAITEEADCGRQEPFGENSAQTMLRFAGEAIFAGNWWWAKRTGLCSKRIPICKTAMEIWMKDNLKSGESPGYYKGFMVCAVSDAEHLSVATAGERHCLSADETKIATARHLAKEITEGLLTDDLRADWERYFLTVPYKCHLEEKWKWRYLCMGETREAISKATAVTESAFQTVLRLKDHTDWIRQRSNDEPSTHKVAEDIRLNTTVGQTADNNAITEELVRDAQSIASRAFSQKEVLDIVVKDQEKNCTTKCFFDTVAKHLTVVSKAKSSEDIAWAYGHLFWNHQHNGRLSVSERDLRGVAGKKGLVEDAVWMKTFKEHALRKWLISSLDIPKDEADTIRANLEDHAAYATSCEQLVFRQKLSTAGTVMFDFLAAVIYGKDYKDQTDVAVRNNRSPADALEVQYKAGVEMCTDAIQGYKDAMDKANKKAAGRRNLRAPN